MNRGTRPFNDFSEGAVWKATLLSAAAGCASHPSAHKVYEIAGVTRFTFCIDLMHTSCHGVASLAIGSALWSIMFDGPLRGNKTDKLDGLFSEMQSIYDELGTPHRLNRITLGMVCNPNKVNGAYPNLHASAAETRCLVPVMAKLCRVHNSGSSRDAQRIYLFDALARMYELVMQNG